ncbi:glyoxalase superfamily protein [Pleomorphomonas oryzae]|uniref:glyoxalase superfamily protein n=1 Tax=Pleomorphomonas oryzae TaxID=261934 RepID=UPI0003F5E51C|nr:glyoxalase superfamily protein [Pleomorphomonas oryzae]
MSTSREPKALAKSLRQALSERGIEISHSDSLECVARQLGWRDWNTLSAHLDYKPLRLPKHWTIGGSHPQDYDMGADEALGCALIRYRHAMTDPLAVSAGGGFGTLMQTVQADTFRGKRLRFSASLKAEDVGGAATLWLRVDAEKGRVVAFDNMETRPSGGVLSGTTDWLKRSIVLDVPSEAVTVNFGFYLRGTGSVWTRGLELEEVDASVPVTQDAAPHKPKPMNLDFAA